MSNKVLIIGSNSFSGSSFIKFLLEKDYQVYGCSRSAEANQEFLLYKNVKTGNYNFEQLDLNKNTSEICSLIKKNKINFIVNFAAQSMVGESWHYPEHWFKTNAVSLSKLIRNINNFDFIDKYVHVTTPEVYGSCEGFISEEYPYNPSTPYATSRVASDLILKNYFDQYGFPYVATRAANVYGPGQQLYRIIPKSIISILTERKIPLHGGGQSTRSFIHINDVCDATEKVMINAVNGNTYHISTNEIISIRSLVKKISQILHVDFDKVIEDYPERLGKDATYQLSSKKIRDQLKWNDTISLDDGLNMTIEWAKNHLDKLKTFSLEYQHKE